MRGSGALALVAVAALVSSCGGSSAPPAGAGTAVASATAATITATTPKASPPHHVATPTVQPTSGAATPRCDAPALVVSVPSTEGAAGTVYVRIVFTNTGPSPCHLRGFPGVAATDAAGATTVDAAREPSPPVTTVLLAPAAAAHVTLAVRSVPAGPSPCPSYPRLLVTPPDSRRTSSLPVRLKPCAGQMRVTAVEAGPA
jgi:hypothetical protein